MCGVDGGVDAAVGVLMGRVRRGGSGGGREVVVQVESWGMGELMGELICGE